MGTVILLLVAAAVVAIYLLRPPPLPVIVPSNLVWRRLIEQRRPWRERLRWLLSLLLALAIACSIAVAVARAPWWSRVGDAGALVLVIDNAPSMATRGPDGRTRLDHAIAAAAAALDELGDQRAVAVCDTTGRLRGGVAAGRWLDPTTARERLSAISVSPSARRRPLAVPPLPEGSEARILFFTDGVAPPLGPGELRDLVAATDSENGAPEIPSTGVETVSVFAPASNVGVTAIELGRPPGEADRLQLWLQVSHSAPAAEPVRIELYDANGLRLSQTLDLDAAQLFSAAVDATGWALGPIEARVSRLDGVTGEPIGDDLPADDRAWTWNPGARTLDVTLISNRTLADTPLSTLLAARPDILLRVVAPEDELPPETDLGVWDRVAPAEAPSRPALLLSPPVRDWLPLTDEWTSVEPAGWAVGTADRLSSETVDESLSALALERLSADRLRGVRQGVVSSDDAEDHGGKGADWQTLVLQGDRAVVLERPALTFREPMVVTTFELSEDEPPALEMVLLMSALLDRAAHRQPVPGRPAGFVRASAPELLAAHAPRAALARGIPLGEGFLFDLAPGLWLDPRAGADAIRRGEPIILRPDPTLVDVNRTRLAETEETPSTEAGALRSLGTRLLLLVALLLALIESWSFHRRWTV